MKVKNIMFSGFAAAILMGVVAEANAAPVAVASKGYVDSVAGDLTDLSGAAASKTNLVEAINVKLDKVAEVTGGLTDGEYYSSVTQAENGQVAVQKANLATTIEDGVKIAPTTDAVHDAIQDVTYTGGTDINIGADNKVNATYESLDYDNLDDTAMNADKLADGYSIVSVKQVDGEIQLGAKQYIDRFNEYSANETQAPMTKAVYSALQGKQDTLTTTQQAAVDSGITADKVSTYDGYATTKQNTLSEGQLAAVNSGITADKVSTYDGYATTKQDKLTPGKFVAIDEQGNITTTYTAGNNITIDTNGKISTDFPDMPGVCTGTGVTCVLTSEGGALRWAVLTQPVDPANPMSGTEAQAQVISEPVTGDGTAIENPGL